MSTLPEGILCQIGVGATSTSPRWQETLSMSALRDEVRSAGFGGETCHRGPSEGEEAPMLILPEDVWKQNDNEITYSEPT